MKIIKQSVAVVLALVIGLTASVNAFAATARKTYVSDIVAITASTDGNAESQLIKEGYKFIENSNVNSSLKTNVYLGYKETENPEEALTGIAAMNMKGKYNYSDYKQLMEQFKEKIFETIDDFIPVVAEFQMNYEAEKPSALAAYESLNAFKEDKSGKLIGDYLLDYDFSDKAEQEMTDRFMRANTQYILTIMELAAFASDDGENTLIDRMVETGPDGITKKYTGAYPTVAKATQAMNAEYGETAKQVLDSWNDVYQYILNTESELIVKDEQGSDTFSIDYYESKEIEFPKDTDEKIKEYFEGMDAAADTASAAADASACSLYAMLSVTEYGDSTLLDFFKRPSNEVKKEELYPLVDAMSEGQRSQIKMNGLKLTLESAFSNIEEQTEETEKAVETVESVAESIGVTSIYDGVDQSIFEDGVAFTSAATEHEQLTGETWLAKLTGSESDKEVWLKSIIVSSVITGVLAATCLGAAWLIKYNTKMAAAAHNKWYALSADVDEIKDFLNGKIDKFMNFTQENAFEVIGGIKYQTDEFYNVQMAIRDKSLNAADEYFALKDSKITKISKTVKCVSFVLFVVAFAYDIYSICEYFASDDLTEEKIPHHLMTVAQTPYGEDYVYYETVKNLKGEAADTNNHEADAKIGWLVLYTTKDKSAGDPILTKNLKAVNGIKNISPDSSFVTLFNETAAVNLTDEKYTGVKDSTGGTYILFNRDASIFAEGSAITNGTAAIIGVGGLAVGAILGAVITKLAGRKKKKEEAPAEA